MEAGTQAPPDTGAAGPLSEVPPVDDGLGPADPSVDPNSEEVTGIPGGAKPGDDNYVEPTEDPDPAAAGEGGEPPTPPAVLPDDGEEPAEEDDQPPAPQLALDGFRQLGVKVGGRKPDASILKLKGGKIDLGKGQFDRGDRLIAVAVLQVTGDNDQDTIDTATGEVKSARKTQNATLCDIGLIESWLLGRLEDATPEVIDGVFEALQLERP